MLRLCSFISRRNLVRINTKEKQSNTKTKRTTPRTPRLRRTRVLGVFGVKMSIVHTKSRTKKVILLIVDIQQDISVEEIMIVASPVEVGACEHYQLVWRDHLVEIRWDLADC